MKTILRNFFSTLKRYSTSSAINIAGLALAFAALYIILVQLSYDFGYNRSITDSERIYRLECPDWYNPDEFMFFHSRPVPELMISTLPQIEQGGMGVLIPSKGKVEIEQNGSINELDLYIHRISLPLLKVFSFEQKAGNLQDLAKPNTIAISESSAKRLNLKVGSNAQFTSLYFSKKLCTVVAIYADFPTNSDLGTVEAINDVGKDDLDNYGRWAYNYYFKLRPNVTPESLDEPMYELHREYMVKNGFVPSAEEFNRNVKKFYRLTPINNTYFIEDVHSMGNPTGNRTTSYTLLTIAILIVLIALINYVNFFFALVPRRIKTINTLKIFGSPIASLRANIIFESIGLVIIALACSGILIKTLETSVVAQFITPSMAIVQNLPICAITIATAILIALISGIYPAIYITSFPVAMVIKGSFASSKAGTKLRYGLVGLQFVISTVLIIATMFIKIQHSYMLKHDTGFKKEQIVSLEVPPAIGDSAEKRTTLTNKLLANPHITDLIWTSDQLVSKSTKEGVYRDFDGKQISFQIYFVTYNFLKFIGVDMVDGSDFSPDDAKKEDGAIIFNQKARDEFGLSLEKKLGIYGAPIPINGFCKNFNFRPLKYDVEPLAIYVDARAYYNHIYFKTVNNINLQEMNEFVQDCLAQITSSAIATNVNLQPLEGEMANTYTYEKNLTSLISLFALLSVIISLMGVFGLVMFETQYRRKEIGVRRVHGATIAEILKLLNNRYIHIILVCFVIAIPISYYTVNRWLATFAYRTPMHWWVFAVAFLAVLAITVATVTIRSYRTATENPAQSIKTE